MDVATPVLEVEAVAELGEAPATASGTDGDDVDPSMPALMDDVSPVGPEESEAAKLEGGAGETPIEVAAAAAGEGGTPIVETRVPDDPAAMEAETLDEPSKVLEENPFTPARASVASPKETGGTEEKKPVHPLPRLFGWGKKRRSKDLNTLPTANAGTGDVEPDPTGALRTAGEQSETPLDTKTGHGTEEPFVLVAMRSDETPTPAAAVEGVIDINAPEPGALVGGGLPSLRKDAPGVLVEEDTHGPKASEESVVAPAAGPEGTIKQPIVMAEGDVPMSSGSHDQVDKSNESSDVAGTVRLLEETAVDAQATGSVVPGEVGMPSAVADGQGEPKSSKKKKGGFSLQKLFGWDKGKPRSGVENESPAASGEQPSATASPAVGDVATIDKAAMSPTVAVDGPTTRKPEGSVTTTSFVACERASDATEAVSESIKTTADQIAPDVAKKEEAEKPSSTEACDNAFAGGAQLEPPILPVVDKSPTPATTDVYNLKVQVGPEHGFPVVALDQPIAELSPLARHFPEFAPKAGKPVVDGDGIDAATLATSAPPLAGPGVDEKEQLKGLAPASLAEEAAKSEESLLDSAAGKPATPDADFRITASPPTLPVSSVVHKPPSSMGKEASGGDVCGITNEGIADTSAAFGVVDMSEMMATEELVDPSSPKAEGATAPHGSPAAEAAPAATGRAARLSQSPGWKGYAVVGDDDAAAAPPPEGAPPGTTGEASAAEARAAETSLYAVSPPESKDTMNVCSPNKQDCVIS
ncbi:unnamed protein product [Ectocarpus sp. 12 AP-2014]